MRIRSLPLVNIVVNSGPDDPVFDGLLLLGPVVIGLIALLGRSLIVQVIVVAYIIVFVAHVLSNALR